MRLLEERLLRRTQPVQLVGLCQDGPDFAPLDLAYQSGEHARRLPCAADHRQILELERPQVELDDRSGDGTGGHVAAAHCQRLKERGPARPANEVEHDVEGALG